MALKDIKVSKRYYDENYDHVQLSHNKIYFGLTKDKQSIVYITPTRIDYDGELEVRIVIFDVYFKSILSIKYDSAWNSKKYFEDFYANEYYAFDKQYKNEFIVYLSEGFKL